MSEEDNMPMIRPVRRFAEIAKEEGLSSAWMETRKYIGELFIPENQAWRQASREETLKVSQRIDQGSDCLLHFPFLGGDANHCVFIQTQEGENALIDCGSYSGEKSPWGVRRYLSDYLSSLGVKKIDNLFITMYDRDHIGGLETITAKYPVNKLIFEPITNNRNRETRDKLQSKYDEIKQVILYPGDEIQLSEYISMRKIGPLREYNSNNCRLEKPDRCNSTVLKLNTPSSSALLMSDAQIPAEIDMMESEFDLSSEILMCGHHGDGPVNSQDFIKSVNPEMTILENNCVTRYYDQRLDFHHKFNSLSTHKLLETNVHGSIVIGLDQNEIKTYYSLNPGEGPLEQL